MEENWNSERYSIPSAKNQELKQTLSTGKTVKTRYQNRNRHRDLKNQKPVTTIEIEIENYFFGFKP